MFHQLLLLHLFGRRFWQGPIIYPHISQSGRLLCLSIKWWSFCIQWYERWRWFFLLYNNILANSNRKWHRFQLYKVGRAVTMYWGLIVLSFSLKCYCTYRFCKITIVVIAICCLKDFCTERFGFQMRHSSSSSVIETGVDTWRWGCVYIEYGGQMK